MMKTFPKEMNLSILKQNNGKKTWNFKTKQWKVGLGKTTLSSNFYMPYKQNS